jgi:ribose-phosphate pyrophosphokinase
MELLILIDAARRASAYRITAVIPYFGYARQDRKDQPRVPITAKLVANLLVAAGANRVLTLDLHAQQIQGFFDIPVDHLYAAPVLIRYIRQKKIENLVVVSPDVGGLKLASAYAEPLGATLAIVAKRRKSPTETDLTETAGTLANAATLLKKYGARDIYAGVSHAVFTDIAHERLKKSQILELITTDSTPVRLHPECRITVLSIAEVLGEGIHRICTNESVSSLFEINANHS